MNNNLATKRNIFAISFLALFFCCASFAVAATCDPSSGYFCNPLNTSGNGTDTIADIVILMIKAILSLIGIFALLFIVIGAIQYIVAAGSEDSMRSAKHTITSALTGLALSLVSYGIVTGLEEMLKIKN